MIEDESDKQVHTSTGGKLKKRDMVIDENDKQVRTSTGQPLKRKQMFKKKRVEMARTYADILSTGNISDERER